MNQLPFSDYMPLARRADSVSRRMLWVLAALIPGIVAATWQYGVGVLVNAVLCTATALIVEAVFLLLRKKPVFFALGDGSAVVTAWILALSIVPVLPWQVTVTATAFAMVVKHLYGGLGQNPFNPAMAAVCFMILAFPSDVNGWYTVLTTKNASDQIKLIFSGYSTHNTKIVLHNDNANEEVSSVDLTPPTTEAAKSSAEAITSKSDAVASATPATASAMPKTESNPLSTETVLPKADEPVALAPEQENAAEKKAVFDAIASATPLTQVKPTTTDAEKLNIMMSAEYLTQLLQIHGSLWLSLAYIAGGLLLLNRKIISWRAPVAFLMTVAVVSGMFWLFDSAKYAPPIFHLLAGGVMIGAFFIVTDPVTAATTPKGQLWFGAGAGLLVCLIRAWGSYPDGVAFSVLLMNIAAPVIDRMTLPTPFGKDA